MGERRVHIVDDDPMIRKSVAFMLATEDIETTQHDCAEAFLVALPDLPEGCLLLDLRLGETSGLELQRQLHEMGRQMPVVVMTGHGDVPTAVAAMKEGAVDYIQKPFTKTQVITALQQACNRMVEETRSDTERENARRLLKQLSPREHQVVAGLAHGKPNKNIAFDLGISPRTVEIHRANAMKKLEVRTLPDLLHVAFLAGIMDE